MPEQEIHQSGTFSTKSGKISTSAECSNSCDFGIIFFFLEVENFPLKWKNFHFAYLGSKVANAKVQNPKAKFRHSGNFSTKSGKISTSAECSNSCDFGINFFFREIFLRWKIFHLWWKIFHIFHLGCKLANEKV